MDSIHKNMKETSRDKNLKENIEVWEDLVNIKDLVISLIICSVTSLGGYFLAPNEDPKPLFFGLSGAILGFIICTLLVKPKRTFIEEGKES